MAGEITPGSTATATNQNLHEDYNFIMKFHKRTIFFFLPFFFILSAQANLEGKYYCKGYDPFFKVNYEGLMVITKTGDTYKITSTLGEDKYTGTGILDKNGSLVASFINHKNSQESGIEIYEVSANGNLNATWTSEGKEQLAKKICLKQ